MTDAHSILTASQFVLGGGDDSVSMTTGTVKAATIGAGSGADTITITSAAAFQSSTFYGGGGADSVTLNDVLVGASNVVNLDSTANGGGADTLKLTTIVESNNTIKGKGGKDADLQQKSALPRVLKATLALTRSPLPPLLATTHCLSVVVQQYTIALTAGISGTVVSATVQGGGGADSIFITAGLGAQSTEVFSGAGADTITWNCYYRSWNSCLFRLANLFWYNDVISEADGISLLQCCYYYYPLSRSQLSRVTPTSLTVFSLVDLLKA